MRGWATRGLPPRTHLQCIRCAGLPRIGRVAGFPHEETPQALDMSPCEAEHHWPCNWKHNQRERIDASVAPPPRGSGALTAVAARSDPWKRLTKTQLRSMKTLPDDLYDTRDVSK